jgi:hypothetical protein
VGWPINLPAHRKPDRADLPDLPALPRPLLARAEQVLQRAYSDQTLSASVAITLWANAVAAARRADTAPAEQFGRIVANYRADLVAFFELLRSTAPTNSDEPTGPDEPRQKGGTATPAAASHTKPMPLDSLFDAASAWVQALTEDGELREAVVSIAKPATNTISSRMLARVVTTRRYFGIRSPADGPIVVVVERDGSRRYLSSVEQEYGRGGFEWGYGGGGPASLAQALLADALNDADRCPTCFGATPLTGWLITCDTCDNTGTVFPADILIARLVSTVISKLPTTPATGGVEWVISQRRVLTDAGLAPMVAPEKTQRS